MIPTTAMTAGGYGLGGLLGAGIGRVFDGPREAVVRGLGYGLNNLGISDTDLSEGDMTPLFGEGTLANILGFGANTLLDPWTYSGAISGTLLGHGAERLAVSATALREAKEMDRLRQLRTLADEGTTMAELGLSPDNLLVKALKQEAPKLPAGRWWADDAAAALPKEAFMESSRKFSPVSAMTPEYLRAQAAMRPDKMIQYELSPLQESLASLLESAPLSPAPFRREPGIHGYIGSFNPWQ